MTATIVKKSVEQRRLRRSASEIGPPVHELSATDARSVRLAAPTEGSEQLHLTPVRATSEIDLLYAAFPQVNADEHPRTARVLTSSSRKVAQKVIEEAGEVALAAVKHNRHGVVRESADVLYQLAVLWHRAGVLPEEVWGEMRRRVEMLGIAEKLPKVRDARE